MRWLILQIEWKDEVQDASAVMRLKASLLRVFVLHSKCMRMMVMVWEVSVEPTVCVLCIQGIYVLYVYMHPCEMSYRGSPAVNMRKEKQNTGMQAHKSCT